MKWHRVVRTVRKGPESVLFLFALGIIPMLPRRAVVCLANSLGSMGFRFSARERNIALANLEMAYRGVLDEPARRQVALESFQTMALTFLDLFWFGFRTRRRLAKWVAFDDSLKPCFDTAPLVIVTGHIGNWEVTGLAAAARGYPLTSVAMPLANRFVDRLLFRWRQATGQRIVQRQGAIKTLLRALKEGQLVALLMDQNTPPREGGVFVNFFGLPVAVSRAPAGLIRRSGAPVMLGVCRRRPRGQYVVSAEGPFTVGQMGQSDEAITQFLQDRMEAVVRAEPGQWLWMYKRWKYVPDLALRQRYPYYARPLCAREWRVGGEKDP